MDNTHRTQRRRTLRRIGLIGALLQVVSCSDLFGPNGRTVIMDIAPQLAACNGAHGPQQCLRVREHPDTVWHNIFAGIEGFEFEPGFAYTIRANVRELQNPPQDAPGVVIRLLAILEKQPA